MKQQQPESPRAQRSARQISTPVLAESTPSRFSALLARAPRLIGLVAGVITVLVGAMIWQTSFGAKAPGMTNSPLAAAAETSVATPVAIPGADTSAGASAGASSGAAVLNSQAPPKNLQLIWQDRLIALDQTRAQAFEQRDQSLLDLVNVPNSPAATYDSGLIASMNSMGVKPVDFQTTIHSAKPISGDESSALLEVVDSRGEYVLTTESMTKTVKRFKASENRTWRVSLRNIDNNWRIYSVVPV